MLPRLRKLSSKKTKSCQGELFRAAVTIEAHIQGLPKLTEAKPANLKDNSK